MRPALALAAIACLCSTPSIARPKESKSAALVKEAEALYAKGQYREAAAKLKEANDLEPHPRLIYNIARAYDQAGDLKEALDYYRQYVSSPEDTDAALVNKANLAMDRLRALIAKEDATREQQEAEKKKLEEEKRNAEEKARAETEAAQKAREEYEAKQRAEAEARQKSASGRKIISYTAVGVGAVGLGVGALFTLNAAAQKTKFREATTVDDKRLYAANTTGSALIADAGWAVMLAGGATAFFLWPRAPEEPKKETDIKAAFVPAPGGGAFSVSGSF